MILLRNFILYSLASAHFAQAQGPLTPPGPPEPTMKSLDQIEARIPVNAATCPGSNVSSYVIINPGSYYLTSSLTGEAGKAGITIVAANVTLDLNGFTLNGNLAGSTGLACNGANNVVRNGTVSQWVTNGVHCIGTGAKVEFVSVDRVTGVGIIVNGKSSQVVDSSVTGSGGGINGRQDNSVVRDCAVSGISVAVTSPNLYGIQGSLVSNCSVSDVKHSGGISTACYGIFGKQVERCFVSDVQSAANTSCGISATVVLGCVYEGGAPINSSGSTCGIRATTVKNSTVRQMQVNSSANSHIGINASLVEGCAVEKLVNLGSGVLVAGIRSYYMQGTGGTSPEMAVVKNCVVSGVSGTAINVSGNGLVEGNLISNGTIGIAMTSGMLKNNATSGMTQTGMSLTGGVATGNCSMGDATPYNFSVAVRSGPVLTGGGSGAFDPNANISQ